MSNKYDFYDLEKVEELAGRPETVEIDGYYWDPTDLPPKDYLDTQVPLQFRNIGKWMRSKMNGLQTRETMARLAEMVGINTHRAVDVAERTQIRQDAVEDFNNQVIQEMTDKDVISAPEIIDARGGKATLGQRLDETTAQLAQTTKGNKPSWSVWEELEQRQINVKWYGAIGDGITDDTISIQNAIQACDRGDTLYFPNGTYITNGIQITKEINIKGNNITSTIIKNMGVSPAILINPPTEFDYRMSIKDIQIKGNGTKIYGEGATSGHGIQVNKAPYIDIDNVRITSHGGHGIYFNKEDWSWSHEIKNSFIGYNKLDGINAIGYSGRTQKNDIDVINCSISLNGKSGLNLWGVKYNILRNSIDGHLEYGLKCDKDELGAAYSFQSLTINDNYFEQNRMGHLLFNVGYEPYINVIAGLTVTGNYFYVSNGNLNADVTSTIQFKTTHTASGYNSFSYLYFGNNSSLIDGLPNVSGVDFGNALTSTCVVLENFRMINHTGAHFIGDKKRVSFGFLEAKGVGWDNIGNSNQITSATKIYFPLHLPSQSTLLKISLPVETDSTDWIAEIKVMNKANSDISYTELYKKGAYNKSGSFVVEGITKRYLESADTYVEINITRILNSTNFTIGNLYYEYI